MAQKEGGRRCLRGRIALRLINPYPEAIVMSLAECSPASADSVKQRMLQVPVVERRSAACLPLPGRGTRAYVQCCSCALLVVFYVPREMYVCSRSDYTCTCEDAKQRKRLSNASER